MNVTSRNLTLSLSIPFRCNMFACTREVPQARSLDKDWRASKSKPGSAPGPSSKEWANYRSQAHEGPARTPAAPEHTERQPHARQRHARNNPEWMADGAAAGSEDASGLSAAARKAKDFEAERQRMKEEWKQEQTQLRGAAHQPVNISSALATLVARLLLWDGCDFSFSEGVAWYHQQHADQHQHLDGQCS